MTLGANVHPIPESLVFGETLDDYTLKIDYSIPMGDRQAQVPALGDAYEGISGNSAPWGYIAIEVGSAQAGTGVNRGAYVTTVKFAKPKILPGTSEITYTNKGTGMEVARSALIGRRGRYMGTRTFIVEEAYAETVATTYYPEATPFASSGNWAGAILRECQIEHSWRVGLARIHNSYDSYQPIGDVIVIGKGILECDASSILRDVPIDETTGSGITHPVEQEFLAADGFTLNKYALIKGTLTWPYCKADLRIRVLLTASNLSSLAPLLGKFNSDTCSAILGATANQLWFWDLQFRQRKYGSGLLYDATIHLLLDPDENGWQAQCVVQLQELIMQRQKVMIGDVDTDQTRVVGVWKNVSGSSPTNILAMKSTSFSLINGYMT